MNASALIRTTAAGLSALVLPVVAFAGDHGSVRERLDGRLGGRPNLETRMGQRNGAVGHEPSRAYADEDRHEPIRYGQIQPAPRRTRSSPIKIVETEPHRSPETSNGVDELVRDAARRHGLDPALVAAVIEIESDFQPRAVSPAGAMGLMQLMPGTARELGVRSVFDPAANVEGGCAYLARQLGRFGGDLELALAAYNAGPEAVRRYGGVPPYPETRDYIRRVKARLRQFREAEPASWETAENP